jgi:hypothetical protein
MQHGNFRFVLTVFGAPVALCNPGRLTFFGNRVTHIFADIQRIGENFTHRSATDYFEHFVRFANIYRILRVHQVAAESDFGGLVSFEVKRGW